MSAVRIESSAFADERYVTLARLAGLADADHARGKMLRIWRQCTDRGTEVLTTESVESVLGPNGVVALLKSELGEQADDGIRICGTSGRIEWLENLRKNGKKGGRAKRKQMVSKLLASEEKEKEKEVSGTSGSGSVSGSSPASGSGAGLPVDREQGPRAPASFHEATSAPLRDVAPADAERRGAVLRALTAEHVRRYNAVRVECGVKVPPMQPIGDPAERALRELMLTLGVEAEGIEGFALQCRHVMLVRDTEARKNRALTFFGASMWKPDNFARACSMTPGEERKGRKHAARVEPLKPHEYPPTGEVEIK